MKALYSEFGSISVYGFFFVAALATTWWLSRRNAVRLGIAGSHIDFVFPVAVVAGIAGGWLLSLAMPQDQLLAGEVLRVDMRIRTYAVVVFGAVVVFVYSRLASLSFRRLLDSFALPMLIGIALGRFACFHVGCCWGDVAVHDPWLANLAATSVGLQVQTLPWLAGDWVLTAVQYGPGTWPYEQQLALGLISPGAELSLPVHPVQLYEAALIALAVLVLGRAPAGGAGPGWLAAATVTAYAVITFVLEYLRADGVLVLGNLTITQLQSFVVTAAATAAAWHAGRHRPVHA